MLNATVRLEHVGEAAERNHPERHAQGPDVALAAAIILGATFGPLEALRREELQRASVLENVVFFLVEELRGAEICKLYASVRIKQHILGFQVAMNDFVVVQISYGLYELP